MAGHSDQPDVNVAYRWAKIYNADIEFRPLFDWLKDRSNPERTDFKQILESLPLHWGPEDLPPPLRRFFMAKMRRADNLP